MTRSVFGIYWATVFAVVAVPALLLVTIIPGVMNRRRVARGGSRLLFRLTGMLPRLHNSENLPPANCVVVANHASYLDGIIMTAALPARFAFVIKKEMMSVPLAGFFLQRIGSHFVERTNPHKSAMDARGLLRSAHADQSLGFFPEGTFHREPGLRRFHKGAFAIAAKTGLPVVPVAIRGSRHILPDGQLLPRAGKIAVTLLDPIEPAGLSIESLSRGARARILAEVGEPDLEDRLPAQPAARIPAPLSKPAR